MDHQILAIHALDGRHIIYRSRYHRDLHSFPTRRSSDLHSVGRFIVPHSLHFSVLSACSSPAESDASGKTGAGEGFAARDRKSTRLNSSHRTISYAVFCLKKKNTPPLRAAPHP